MINKKMFYYIALLLTALIFILVGIAGAEPYAYITNQRDNTVSVIDINTNTVAATVYGFNSPYGVVVTPDGSKVYVTNQADNTVSVINTTTNTVISTVPVGSYPTGIAVSPDGTNVYVANYNSITVSIINTATNNVNNMGVGNGPASFGKFIEKLTPIINWSKPADITYGTALSSTQLDASASDPISGATVPGTFVYNPPAGTLLNAGTQLLNTIFMPTDTVNYNSASASVLINVLTNLGNSNGNGVTFTNWGNNNVYIINPATNNLEAAASVGYMSPSPGQFWSSPVVPTITWNNPANINYGTALSSIQLDATSSVPGTFVYALPAGTVLGVGTQALNAFFTPNDLVHYTNTSASVWINVVNIPTCESGVTFKPNPITQAVDL